MNILGNKIILRAVELEDMEFLRNMLNDPDLEKFVGGWSFPISGYNQIKWFESSSLDKLNQRFIIETPEDGAVGLATLGSIDWKNRSAFHGIKLAKKDVRGKGIGTDTVMALMRYAFDELGLHRLDGAILEDNIASIRLYQKCGWKREGLKEECVYKNGEWKNLYIVGILEQEYRKLIAGNSYFINNCGVNNCTEGGGLV